MNANQSVVIMVNLLCQTPEIVTVLLLLAAAIISFVKTKSGLLLVIASGIWALVGCFDFLTLQILLPFYLLPEIINGGDGGRIFQSETFQFTLQLLSKIIPGSCWHVSRCQRDHWR